MWQILRHTAGHATQSTTRSNEGWSRWYLLPHINSTSSSHLQLYTKKVYEYDLESILFSAGVIFYTINQRRMGGQLRAPLWRALSVYVLLFIALILSIDRGESFLGCYPSITHWADLLFTDITGQAGFRWDGIFFDNHFLGRFLRHALIDTI